jgi:hypothetical protein
LRYLNILKSIFIIFQDLSKIKVSSFQEAIEIINYGKRNIADSEITASRSSFILTLEIEISDEQILRKSSLTFVELHGNFPKSIFLTKKKEVKEFQKGLDMKIELLQKHYLF